MPYWLGRPLALIAVGAILAFAVHVYVPHVDVPTAGLALLLVGLLDLSVSLWFVTASRPRRRRRRTGSRLVGWLTGASEDADGTRRSRRRSHGTPTRPRSSRAARSGDAEPVR